MLMTSGRRNSINADNLILKEEYILGKNNYNYVGNFM